MDIYLHREKTLEQGVSGMKHKKFNFSGIIAFAIAVLVLVVFVPFNIIADFNEKVYDMTPSKQYTLNSKTKELLDETSDKDIQVYFLLESLDKVKESPEYLALYHTLSELKKRDNVTLTCFDPNEDKELAQSLDPDNTKGVERGDVFVKCGDIINRVSHDKIFQTSKIGDVNMQEYAGEELIASAIKFCTAGSLKTMYFLTGHGEKSIDSTYASFARTIRSNNYGTDTLNLDETGSVPGNTAALWLVGPQKDITEKERDILLSFIDNGGSVSMLLGPSETEGRFRNLEAVLKVCGIEMDYNFVTETFSTNQLRDHEDNQNPAYFTVTYRPFDSESYTQDLTTDLLSRQYYDYGIFNTRSLAQLPDTQYDGSKYEVCPIISNITNIDDAYTTKSVAMGGDEDTADFANNELNNVLLDFGMYSYNRVSGGKVFVLGTNDIIDPEYLPKNPLATYYLALFANTWLYDNDIDMGIGSKTNAYDTMTFKDADEAKHVMAMTTILPGALLLFGIFVWLKRRHA